MKFLSVYLDESNEMLIPVDFVIEVTKQDHFRSLPKTKRGFIGVTDVRNEVLPLFSLMSNVESMRNMVILGNNGSKICFCTNSVESISNLDLSGKVPVKKNDFTFDYDGINVLDVESIWKVLG
jgi:chemotaxis signal transduction protein